MVNGQWRIGYLWTQHLKFYWASVATLHSSFCSLLNNCVAVYPEFVEGSHSYTSCISIQLLNHNLSFLIIQFQSQTFFQLFYQRIPFHHLEKLLTGSKWCTYGDLFFFVFFHYNKKLEKIIMKFLP